jgi:hypothetical protein
VILKIVLNVHVHWKKFTSENKGKPEQKYDAAFGTIFSESGSVFKEASKNFIFIFLLN